MGRVGGLEPEVLFSLDPYVINDYDASEDGRFVMIRRRGAERPGELIVVENWFEELKTKVGDSFCLKQQSI